MDKVYCYECRHCNWYKRQGDLSQCSKKRKPDEQVDDPVVGPRVVRGELLFCSVANKHHECEEWERADESTILQRQNPELNKDFDPLALLPIAAIIIGFLIVISLVIAFAGD